MTTGYLWAVSSVRAFGVIHLPALHFLCSHDRCSLLV
jgi:hypothetical protein